jgi:hypothetical protein
MKIENTGKFPIFFGEHLEEVFCREIFYLAGKRKTFRLINRDRKTDILTYPISFAGFKLQKRNPYYPLVVSGCS